ncbi:outer membrane lipoprotein LolB [Undibacterium sp. CY7W]|uniref:Outer-membrane lipoprotein LolB n=1 Tax=Undibacterium rugosum TaxID=2762291 RepID=A0A923I1U9_9BURK|nr:lipoprotein insertase outer membrane protein LolB [Undibacterium rugosum]MBC3934825.1 outer membrane lipoprotein LolB [Undibacterium rugosum]
MYLIKPLLLSTLLLISACSLVPVSPSASGTLATQPASSYQQQISLSGKLFIRYEQNGKAQQLPGNFDWKQNAQNLVIDLYNPLGQTIARITQTAQSAVLEQQDKLPLQADNLEQLLQDSLHFPLPVSGLRYWLQGQIRAANGQLSALSAHDQVIETDGWKIRYASWHQPGVPRRMELSRYTTEAGQVSLQIILEAPSSP